eukprot:XP_013985541.1 PREDICTED: zinc finger protein 658B-like isoform X4 [Salmo salar]
MQHQQVHSGEKPYSCSDCGKRFTHKSTVSMHKKKHCLQRIRAERPSGTGQREQLQENSKPRKTYSCSECGRVCLALSILQIHMRKHTEEKPYPCPDCEKKFATKSQVKAHQRTHTGEKRFSCPDCGKDFAYLRDMKVHQKKRHTEENVTSDQPPIKTHSCSVCGRQFSARNTLGRHLLIHSGVTPHKCAECGKCFTQKNNMISHQLTHTGEKPYSCDQCGKRFTRKRAMKIHQQSPCAVKKADTSHHDGKYKLKTPKKSLQIEGIKKSPGLGRPKTSPGLGRPKTSPRREKPERSAAVGKPQRSRNMKKPMKVPTEDMTPRQSDDDAVDCNVDNRNWLPSNGLEAEPNSPSQSDDDDDDDDAADCDQEWAEEEDSHTPEQRDTSLPPPSSPLKCWVPASPSTSVLWGLKRLSVRLVDCRKTQNDKGDSSNARSLSGRGMPSGKAPGLKVIQRSVDLEKPYRCDQCGKGFLTPVRNFEKKGSDPQDFSYLGGKEQTALDSD